MRLTGPTANASAWPLALARVVMSVVMALAAEPAFAAGIDVRDDRGAALTFDAPPRRIVSLLPSLTESVCALGACERLVGTDRYSNAPASVEALPKLGGIDDAHVEAIVALRPDVVLAAPSARVVDRLEALGVRVLALESREHADVKRTLDVLARLLGVPERAARVWARIEGEIAAAAARVPAAQHGRRVYFEVDTTPYAAGAGSFIGETLARLGVANAVGAELGPFPKLNPEHVVRLQPDVVMATRASVLEMPRRPGWSALRALQRGQSCGFAPEYYEVLVRPGPRLGEAAALLADCLSGLSQRSEAPAKLRSAAGSLKGAPPVQATEAVQPLSQRSEAPAKLRSAAGSLKGAPPVQATEAVQPLSQRSEAPAKLRSAAGSLKGAPPVQATEAVQPLSQRSEAPAKLRSAAGSLKGAPPVQATEAVQPLSQRSEAPAKPRSEVARSEAAR